jgi:serine/threonine-protein kinase RsbW
MTDQGQYLRLQIRSQYEMLELVQVVSDRITQLAGLDEDAVHWVGVAIRESVINAIKHGNRHDESKAVLVDFSFQPVPAPTELVITVVDQGNGFEVTEVADPLAPENMLKASGRGIFFMRSFMDDVRLRKVPEGGMEVQLVKRLPAPPAALSEAAPGA